MYKLIIKTGILAALFMGSNAQAAVHTWHNVKSVDGNWIGRLAIITAQQGGYFADEQSQSLGTSYDFTLLNDTPVIYGFGFDYETTDFNVAYTVSLYQKDSYVAKACVYTVTASGPGIPDIRINSFNGADCKTSRASHRGTDFIGG